MSCGSHPQWYHDREDCPMCAAARVERVVPPTPDPIPALRALRDKLRDRVHSLVNRGSLICPTPTPTEGMSHICDICGYTMDLHLIRDILVTLERALETKP